MQPVKLGETSTTNPTQSRQLARVTGRTQVNLYDRWYNLSKSFIERSKRVIQLMLQTTNLNDHASVGGGIKAFHQVTSRLGETHHRRKIDSTGGHGQTQTTFGSAHR